MKNKNLTKEYCHDIAKSCTSREHFKQTNIQAYRLASRAGWLTKWFPINHFYTFLPIKYVLVISCFIAMHCSCVSKNCNLMSLGLV